MQYFTRRRMMTVGAALGGAAFFLFFGLPLPLLLGPMAGCLVAALAGAQLQDMGVIGTFFRTFLGVVIGTTVTPQLVHDLPSYGWTLALIPAFVAVIGLAGYPLLRHVMGYDPVTAYFSAMPGGLQDMLVFGEEAGGNVRTMSLIHATRVLSIVTVVPFIMAWLLDLDLTRPPGVSALALPPSQVAIMIAAGYAGWKLAARVGMFGASILGPMILTAILSLAGIVHSRPPVEMIGLAQVFIGIAVGAKYTGITTAELRHDVLGGVLFSVLLAAISIGFILVALGLSSVADIDIWLAFLPGGQAEMALIAIVAGADVAFVVAHHVFRIFVVIMFAPVVMRRVVRH